VAALTVSFIMDTFVLRKIAFITKEFQHIEDTREFDRRLPEDGIKEIRLLSSTANSAFNEIYTLNKQLMMMTNVDGLTGIANRRFFDDTYAKEFRRAQRNKLLISVLMIDIDHFKDFNDTHGHLSGDECLKTVANVIRSCLNRPGDFAARFGGEEFVVILPETDETGAMYMAEFIRMTVENLPICLACSDKPLKTTVSIGAATAVPDPEAKPSSLVADADAALYIAKKSRNTALHFSKCS